MKMTDKTEVSILFLGLSDAEKEECQALFRTKDLTKGELIASEGDLCQGLFIIEKGDAAAQKYTHSGEFSTLRILEAGDIFGEDQIQKEDGRYTSTLEAISDVSLSYISQSNLNNLVARFPSIREGLWKLLLQRLKLSDERVILLSQKSVRSKISYYLLRLSESSSRHPSRFRGPGKWWPNTFRSQDRPFPENCPRWKKTGSSSIREGQ